LKNLNVSKLINKFLKGNTNPVEEEILNGFLNSYQDKEDAWPETYGDRSEIEVRLFEKLNKKIVASSKVKEIVRTKKINFYKYAAAILALVGLIGFWNVSNSEKEFVLPVSDEIVLKLSDGTTKIIDVAATNSLVDSKGKVVGVQLQDKLSYTNSTYDSLKETQLVFNELYVPYGKKFQVELFDGTKVTLNSGTTLKYPVQFLAGQSREVFLEGEAYFEVTKNKHQAFKVHANSLVTEVFGTEFNISSYSNEEVQEVVLVEGFVGVSNSLALEQVQIRLVPNQKASLNNSQEMISTESVQIENYIAWKDNVLLFSNLKFKDIIKKLERHYNVKIENDNFNINENRYTGTFETETIDQVLKSLSNISAFSYQIEGDSISIFP